MKTQIARRYNKLVTSKNFEERDLALKKIKLQRKLHAEGKLALNQEGPDQVIQKLGKGAYQIVELEGQELPRTWNAFSVRKYYHGFISP